MPCALGIQEAKRERASQITFNALSELERETKKEEERIEARAKWTSLFAEEAAKGGWRVVDMFEVDAWARFEQNPLDYIFVTKLTQEEWSILKPALSLLTVEV